jgi:hypothetical protein
MSRCPAVGDIGERQTTHDAEAGASDEQVWQYGTPFLVGTRKPRGDPRQPWQRLWRAVAGSCRGRRGRRRRRHLTWHRRAWSRHWRAAWWRGRSGHERPSWRRTGRGQHDRQRWNHRAGRWHGRCSRGRWRNRRWECCGCRRERTRRGWNRSNGGGRSDAHGGTARASTSL